jgi:hypothetical protein
MAVRSVLFSTHTSRRLPPSHWRDVWAAWCPTCEQDTMPMPSGCCGWCDTHLSGQPTRQWFEPPLRGSTTGEATNDPIAA